MLELHAIIIGKVQGVGFRATARRFAQELQLSGYAVNLPDGTVEICAQGNREEVESFLSKLQQEFVGYIEAVVPQWRPAKTVYKGFSIKFG